MSLVRSSAAYEIQTKNNGNIILNPNGSGVVNIKKALSPDSGVKSATRTNLGLAIGSDVQAYNARLADIANASLSSDDLIKYDGSNLVGVASSSFQTASSALTDIAAVSGNQKLYARDAGGAIVGLPQSNFQGANARLTNISNATLNSGDALYFDGSDIAGYALSGKQAASSKLSDISSLGNEDTGYLKYDGENVVSVGSGALDGVAGLSLTANLLIGTNGSSEIATFNQSSFQAASAKLSDIAGLTPSNGQIVKWNGSNFIAANETNSSYTAGSGLSLSEGEFSIDSSVLTTSNTKTLSNKTLLDVVHSDSSLANGSKSMKMVRMAETSDATPFDIFVYGMNANSMVHACAKVMCLNRANGDKYIATKRVSGYCPTLAANSVLVTDEEVQDHKDSGLSSVSVDASVDSSGNLKFTVTGVDATNLAFYVSVDIDDLRPTAA